MCAKIVVGGGRKSGALFKRAEKHKNEMSLALDGRHRRGNSFVALPLSLSLSLSLSLALSLSTPGKIFKRIPFFQLLMDRVDFESAILRKNKKRERDQKSDRKIYNLEYWKLHPISLFIGRSRAGNTVYSAGELKMEGRIHRSLSFPSLSFSKKKSCLDLFTHVSFLSLKDRFAVGTRRIQYFSLVSLGRPPSLIFAGCISRV